MLENAKKEVEKVLELKNNQKIKIQNYYEFIFTIISFIIIISCFFVPYPEGKFIYCFPYLIFCLILNILLMAMMKSINGKICKKNIIEESGLKLLSGDYLFSNKKRKIVKERFDSLSNPAKKILITDYNVKKIDYNETLMKLYFWKVMSLNIKDFLFYIENNIENDFSLFKFNYSKSEIIEKKLKNILENIKEEEFNVYQQNIVTIIENFLPKSIQLTFLKKIKELREKYDEKVISLEIKNIKDELSKKEKKKVLQSI